MGSTVEQSHRERRAKMLKFLLILAFITYPSYVIKCYECVSEEGDLCDEKNLGKLTDCNRCYIGYGNIGFDTWERGCATGSLKVGCDSLSYLTYCVCDNEFCNENFETAGMGNHTSHN